MKKCFIKIGDKSMSDCGVKTQKTVWLDGNDIDLNIDLGELIDIIVMGEYNVDRVLALLQHKGFVVRFAPPNSRAGEDSYAFHVYSRDLKIETVIQSEYTTVWTNNEGMIE